MTYWRDASVLALVVCTFLLRTGVSQLILRSVETGQPFPMPGNITVGLASDLAVQVQCTPESGTGIVTWEYRNGTEVPSGLQPFGISQGEEGILRVYPANQLMIESRFICSAGTNGPTLNVSFTLGNSLFLSSLCLVHDIPATNVTTLQDGSSTFCVVESERGMYRSVSSTPRFLIEPLNITARPVDGRSTAAFSCTVTNPGSQDIDITWMFQQTGSNDTTPLSSMMDDNMTMMDDNMTILDDESTPRLLDSGSSVLILESVSEEDEGIYFCHVSFNGVSLLTSAEAQLTFNASLSIDNGAIIILHPPTQLMIGDIPAEFTLPCIASDLSMPNINPMFAPPPPPPETAVTVAGLSVVGAAGGAFITCTVGGMMASSFISISSDTTAVPDVSITPNSAAEIIVSEGSAANITCSPDPVSDMPLLLTDNMTPSSPRSFQTDSVNRTDSGFYQCFNSLQSRVDSTYLLVAYLDSPIITPSSQTAIFGEDSTLVFSCSVPSNPLPRLSWSISRNPPSSSLQASLQPMQFPTDFGVPALSNVSVNISSLGVGDYVLTCSADISEVPNLSTSSSVNFSVDVIFENITVTSSNNDIIVGIGPEMINISCSVQASVEPSFEFLRNGMRMGIQTFLMQSGNLYQSSFVLNSSELIVGIENFTCTSRLELGGPSSPPPLTASILINVTVINVTVIFTNITLFPSVNNIFIGTEPEIVNITCSVESSLEPNFNFSRNGMDISELSTQVLNINKNIFQSVITLDQSDLRAPTDFFQCTAFLDSPQVQLELTANTSIMVEPVLRNISITPENQMVIYDMEQTENQDLVILNCTVESNLLLTITWTQDEMVVTGTPPQRIDREDFTFLSQLFLNASDLTSGLVSFTCTASSGDVVPNITATATITVNAAPVFVMDPVNQTIAVLEDNVTLNCTAMGIPLPTITWEDEGMTPILNDSTFQISSNEISADSVSSSLSFVVSELDNRTQNGTAFRCVAMNIVNNRTESELGRLVIAGPPGDPIGLNVTDVTFENATVIWSAPFSLLPITGYSLTITQTQTFSNISFTNIVRDLDPELLSFFATPFLPFSEYLVELQAVSRAGASGRVSLSFNTSESIPAPPINIRTRTTGAKQITVEWDPTPIEVRNGILILFTIQYQAQPLPNRRTVNSVTVNVSTLIFNLTNLTPGTEYIIQIAAHTGAGMGPYSNSIPQSTISKPPNITNMEFGSNQGSATPTSIPIILPDISVSGFSHFWVIAMKVRDDFQSLQNPLSLFPNNDSFVFFSAQPGPMQPYIVAEIDASRYSSARRFTLGSAADTNSFNDNPNLYVNGPLNQSTAYTVFVWGFSTLPPANRQRRQTDNDVLRQYFLFSSSPFLPPINTSTPVPMGPAGPGIAGGVIAGIVVAVVVLVIALVAVIIVLVILYDRFRYNGELGPPPSRKGSVRLRDGDVVRDTVRSSSFRITSLRNQKAEAELQDLNPDDVRLPVAVDEFADYVKKMHKNTDHLFSEEYEIITIKSPSLSHIQCSLPANVQKNRYANINCYDSSRVILERNKEDVNSTDYINGNYIDGYQSSCACIATQGPLANTTHDFWRMVWEQESCCVVMLTNLVEKSRVKCHQYWPEVGSMTLGDLTISLIEVQQLAYYTIRTFRLSKGNERREVKQFHYTGWPDFGVPDYPHPAITFINRLNRFKRTTTGPDIIHCSAGVGRTGTLMAIMGMIEMVKEEKKIDIFNFVLRMRQQRNYMVQTERQYIFIHDAILEFINTGSTEVTIKNIRKHFQQLQAQDPTTDSSLLEREYSHLNELQQVDKTQFQPAQSSINVPKNRFQNILPYDRYRVRLLLHPGVNGSDYINASYVDGYQFRHQYILTQGPMANTVTDFWRMVWEHRCSCIMMLCQLEEKGVEQSVAYWPAEKVRQHGDMFIEQTSINKFPTYTMREFAVTNTKINESRVIKHYQYSDWLDGQTPKSAADIIDLIGVLQKTQHMCGGGPIILHDSTNIGRSATFVVVSSVLEQLKVEGIVDPFFTIHSLRQQQPGLVSSLEQYKFCYQAVMEFLDSFDHYSNFD